METVFRCNPSKNYSFSQPFGISILKSTHRYLDLKATASYQKQDRNSTLFQHSVPSFSIFDFCLKNTSMASVKFMLAGTCRQWSRSCWSFTTLEPKRLSEWKELQSHILKQKSRDKSCLPKDWTSTKVKSFTWRKGEMPKEGTEVLQWVNLFMVKDFEGVSAMNLNLRSDTVVLYTKLSHAFKSNK